MGRARSISLTWRGSPGSSQAVLNGGEPTLLEETENHEPNWPPRELPGDVVERYKPEPGETFTHPEDVHAWSLATISEEERRWLIGHRRALRAGERGSEDRRTGQ